MTDRPDWLPPGFMRTRDAAPLVGRQPRMVRNHCMQDGVAIRLSRPMGGYEYWAWLPGLRAAVDGDTGPLLDAQRLVASLPNGPVDIET